MRSFPLTVAIPALVITASAQEPGAAPRPMRVDDLFTLRELADVSLSPDGRWLAATVTRPGVANPCPTCDYRATGDVWLVDTRTGELRDLTRGGDDGSSSWLPAWSPDGLRLAFVSTKRDGGERDEGQIRLHVWHAATGRVERVADASLSLRVDCRAPARAVHPFAWLDARTLVAVTLPPGVSAFEAALYWRRGVGDARRAWAKYDAGAEPTASVLDTAVPATLPSVTLQRLELAPARATALAELPHWDLWDPQLRLQLAVAPDRRTAAVLAVTGTLPLPPDRGIPDAIRTFGTGVVSLDASTPVAWAQLDARTAHAQGVLLDWSPDGGAFLVTEAMQAGVDDGERRLLVVATHDGSVRAVPHPLRGDAARWTAASGIVVRGLVPSTAGAASGEATSTRRDWWLLPRDGEPVNLTAALPAPPGRLVDAGGALVGLARGALCEVGGEHAAAVAWTEPTLPASTILRPWPGAAPPSPPALLLESPRDGSGALTIATGPFRDRGTVLAPLPRPTPSAELVDGSPSTGFVWRDDTGAGTSLWTTDGNGGHAARRLVVNEHVAGIVESERRLVRYRSTDGVPLQGVVLLPPGYEAGKRYPTVVWVYGGLALHDTALAIAGKASPRPLNLELLAGAGYVVLVPSIPLPRLDGRGDPWLAIPKGVLPCVDALIELGIADADRLAVMGHSTGGYTTYAVVTQTTRFKAAIALSGHPDVLSLYGQLYPGERVNDHAHDGLATVAFAEGQPLQLGGPPWRDLWRYLRNSPLLWLDRVTTPLLIVHGDMDGAPIQQGEEAFVGLQRLGRRARFVRYWGEGHVVGSAPNVRHLWQQVFAWLAEHVGGPSPSAR